MGVCGGGRFTPCWTFEGLAEDGNGRRAEDDDQGVYGC